MKTYPIINNARLKYNATLILCGFLDLIIIIANVVFGLKYFKEYSTGTIIGVEVFFAIFIIVPVVIIIITLNQKSLTFCSVGYDMDGIHIFDSKGKEKCLFKWYEIKDSGIIIGSFNKLQKDIAYGIIVEMIISLLSSKDSDRIIYFSKEILDYRAKKCDDIKIEKSFISVQYNEESLFDIKRYYPEFNISEQ